MQTRLAIVRRKLRGVNQRPTLQEGAKSLLEKGLRLSVPRSRGEVVSEITCARQLPYVFERLNVRPNDANGYTPDEAAFELFESNKLDIPGH